MGPIRPEKKLQAKPPPGWGGVRGVRAVPTRVPPGFVTDVRMDGDTRIVTFANGMTAKELIVDVDDAAQRLVWAVVEGRLKHHNGSIQVLTEGARCRLVWI